MTAGWFTVTGPDGVVLATTTLPFGLNRLIGGIAFSLGLILVVVAGAELFTGNILLVIAWASQRVSTRDVLGNWGLVYAGNFVGAIATVGLVILARVVPGRERCRRPGGPERGGDEGPPHVPRGARRPARCRNALVCLAVWLTYSARSTTDRVLAIVPPIAAFVAAGFEHSIANMFFLPVAIAIRAVAPPEFWQQTGVTSADYADVNVSSFVANLVPVTIGNIIGGAVIVAGVYWFVYLRRTPDGQPRQSPFRRTLHPLDPIHQVRAAAEDSLGPPASREAPTGSG